VLRSDRWTEVADERALLFLGLAFRSVAGPFFCPVVFIFLGRALARKPVPEGPWLYEPDRSPRVIRVESSGGFLSCRRVRASAPMGVAPEPLGGSGGTVWGVLF